MNEGMTEPTKKDCQPEGVCERKSQSLIGRFCLCIKLYHRIYSASCQASMTYETGHNDFQSKYSDSLFILEGILKSHSFILHWRNGWGLCEGKAGRLDGKFLYLVPAWHTGSSILAQRCDFSLAWARGWHPSHECDGTGGKKYWNITDQIMNSLGWIRNA